MSDTKVKIIAAAFDQFSRYGIRRVSMGDVADQAEVSRQTLYAHYKNKDLLCAATMHEAVNRLLEKLQKVWADAPDISAKLDAYIEIAVIEPYYMMQQHPDLKDLHLGVGQATSAVAADISVQKAKLLAKEFGTFEHELRQAKIGPDDLANYFVHTSTDMKFSVADDDQLKTQVGILKLSTLALLNQG